MRTRRWPNERSVSKKFDRMYPSRSAESYPPAAGRSQSVHSLSPGVKRAGARSELRKASNWV